MITTNKNCTEYSFIGCAVSLQSRSSNTCSGGQKNTLGVREGGQEAGDKGQGTGDRVSK